MNIAATDFAGVASGSEPVTVFCAIRNALLACPRTHRGTLIAA